MRDSLIYSILFVLLTAYVENSWAQVKSALAPLSSSPHTKVPLKKEGEREEKAVYEKRILQDPATGSIPDDIRNKELGFARSLQARAKSNKQQRAARRGNESLWQRRGPFNVGGRTRALAIDRTNENVILAGGVSGGMWRSDDGGQSWIKTTLPNQLSNATCVIQDPRPGFANVWYYGTGEFTGNSATGLIGDDYQGNGVFKSTDGGNSWSQLASTVSRPEIYGGGGPWGVTDGAAQGSDFAYVWNLAVSPTTGDVFAATFTGIMRSSDGGVSWIKEINGSIDDPQATGLAYTDVIASPTGVIYATIGGTLGLNMLPNAGFYSSEDGKTWNNNTQQALAAFAVRPAAYFRVVIDIPASDPNQVFYFLVMSGGTGNIDNHGLLRYDVLEDSWVNRSGSLPVYQGAVGNLAQPNYNQILRVKPDDPNYVFVGTINLHRSPDAFTRSLNLFDDYERFNWIGGYSPINDVSRYENHHPDNHNLLFFPSNPKRALSSHDGGISITEDITASPVVWKTLNNGYFTTQAYGLAIDEETPGDTRLTAGFQDNGKWTTYGSSANDQWYEEIRGGDGTYVAIVPGTSPHRRYVSNQNGRLIRVDGIDVENPTDAIDITPPASNRLFVNPFLLNPSDPNTLYYGGGGIWYYNSNLAGGVGSWQLLPGTQVNAFVTAIGASKAPVANVLYWGTIVQNSDRSFTTGLFRKDNAPVGSGRVDIFSGDFPKGAYVSSITVDEKDHLNVLVTFGNYGVKSIWHISDGGGTWIDISGNLEQSPDGTGNGPSVRWAEILNYPSGRKGYFVGTSTGLYYTETLDGLNTVWEQQAPEVIGNAVVTMIKTWDADGLVAVGTHGDGLFSAFYTEEADQAPVVSREIADVEAYTNDAPYQLNLGSYFEDPDGDAVSLSIVNNTNPSITTVAISDKVLTLSFTTQTGSGFVTVRASANGKSVDEIFRVNVQDIVRENILYTQLPPKNFLDGQSITLGKYASSSTFTADDFTVPDGQNWQVEEVVIVCQGAGEISEGNISSADVYFYKDNNGTPAELITLQNIIITGTSSLVPVDSENAYFYTFSLNTPVNLSSGKYWVRLSPNFINASTDYRFLWNTLQGGGNAVFSTPNNASLFRIQRDFAFELTGTASGSSAIPADLQAFAISTNQIQLSWKDESISELGFLIERSNTSGTGFSKVATVGADVHTWTDNTGLATGTTYYYRVRTVDLIGDSDPSNEASATPVAQPDAPTLLNIQEINSNSTTLSWTDNVANELNFEILRSLVAGKSYSRVGTTGANQGSFTLNRPADQDYYYVVRSVIGEVASPYSNEVVGLATVQNLQGAPVNNLSAVRLDWVDASQLEEGYIIERSTEPTGNFQQIGRVNANGTSYLNQQVQRGATYYYRIKTINSQGAASSSEVTKVLVDTQITSISEDFDSSLEVYPNPATEYFTVRLKGSPVKTVIVELFDMYGKALESQIMAADKQGLYAIFKVGYLTSGTYLIRLNDNNNLVNKKVVVP